MNITRAILEGIHEVELQVTPEFQAGWPAPVPVKLVPLDPTEGGVDRHRLWMSWPGKNATVDTVVEVPGEIDRHMNVWAPLSQIPAGSWSAAMQSVKNTGKYSRIYVYVQNDADPVLKEMNDSAMFEHQGGPVTGYETIDDHMPGQEDVVDHYHGYEAKPASEQPGAATAAEEPVVTGSAELPKGLLITIGNRAWLDVMKPSQPIDSWNPVLVKIKDLPIDATDDEKKELVQSKFEELKFVPSWAWGLKVWKIRPEYDQDPGEFATHVNYLINRLDELVFGEEG